MNTSNENYKYSVNFYFNKSNNHIDLYFRYAGKRVKIYTKENLDSVSLWDKKKQRAKNWNTNPTSVKTNKNLSNMETKIGDLFKRFIKDYKRLPTPKELRQIFKREYFEGIPQFTTKKRKTLLEVFDEYIESKKIENTPRTAEKYTQVKNNLLEFGKLHKQEIQFENITNDFRNKFLEFLQENKKYAQSTIYRKMNFIKTILFYALDNKYVDELAVNLKKWATEDGVGRHIALSKDELQELEELDLSQNKRLEHVRDRFLIGCYTGMRFSDFMRLNKNHIQDGEFITIRQKKVGENITIPFFDEVKQIFIKYDYDLPRPISMQNFNIYLKEVARLCPRLKRLQERKSKEPIPRSELVSSHTARRTFATLNASRGIELETLRYVTGHTSIKSLENYIKLNNTQKAKIVSNEFNKVKEEERKKESKGKVINMKTAN